MSYAVRTITEPAIEPIHRQEAKQHLRVPFDDQDLNIDRVYIPAARRRIEAATNRQLITATLELSLDDFPAGSEPIKIPRAPLQSVTSITYVDSAGDRQTLDSADYVVNASSEPATVHPVFGSTWPITRKRTEPGTVLVTFVAGYGDERTDVPAGLREAMLLLIDQYYYFRSNVVMGKPHPLPMAVTDLLESHGFGDEFVDYGGG